MLKRILHVSRLSLHPSFAPANYATRTKKVKKSAKKQSAKQQNSKTEDSAQIQKALREKSQNIAEKYDIVLGNWESEWTKLHASTKHKDRNIIHEFGIIMTKVLKHHIARVRLIKEEVEARQRFGLWLKVFKYFVSKKNLELLRGMTSSLKYLNYSKFVGNVDPSKIETSMDNLFVGDQIQEESSNDDSTIRASVQMQTWVKKYASGERKEVPVHIKLSGSYSDEYFEELHDKTIKRASFEELCCAYQFTGEIVLNGIVLKFSGDTELTQASLKQFYKVPLGLSDKVKDWKSIHYFVLFVLFGI